MDTQSYFHTKFLNDADRRNDAVPLQVNCTGVVSHNSFFNKSVRHDFYFLYLLSGKMDMPECSLLPGDVIIFDPEHPYQYRSVGATQYLWVHYTGSAALSLTRAALPSPNTKRHIGIHQEIIRCFERLFREFVVNDGPSGRLSCCLLTQILLLTERYAASEGKKDLSLSSIEYIHSHFREKIDVDELARMEHLSSSSFRAAFKRHTGTSPNEYIISQRISAACQLLSQTRMEISAVAADVGYSDPYYFSRLFKRKVGVPPLLYRTSTAI